MELAAQFFKAMGDQTRLRLLHLLLRKGELCVCELVDALEESQPKVSRHLGILRSAELVQDFRRGTWIFYKLADDLPEWKVQVLTATLSEASCLTHSGPFAEDHERLFMRPDRPECRLD